MKRFLFFVLILALVFVLATPVRAQSGPEVEISGVHAYPTPVSTIDSHVNFVANVSSTVSVSQVVLYYAYTNSSQTCDSGLHFARYQMDPEGASIGKYQGWYVQVPMVPHYQWVFFYANATDTSGQYAIYPGTICVGAYPILSAPIPTFSATSFQLNGFNLGLQNSDVNLTMKLGAQLPIVSESAVQVYLDSYPYGGYMAYPFAWLEPSTSPNGRFSYSSKATFTTALFGATGNYPYDSYLFGVSATVDYPIQTVYNNTVPVSYSSQIANTMQNGWTVSLVRQNYLISGNHTILSYEFKLARSNLPISLPVIGYASVVLLAAAMLFEPEKVGNRLTVFLGAIAVSLPVLISPTLNPFGFGNTIYEVYFAYLMFANALLIMFSALVWRLRDHLNISSFFDIIGGVIVAAIGAYVFLPTQMPSWVLGWPASCAYQCSLCQHLSKAKKQGLSWVRDS